MSVCRLYDRAGVSTATVGAGTITLGPAIGNSYFTFANAGVQDQDVVRYVIDDGTDFEIGEGVYTAAGTTLTRATVIRSNIAGVQGTTKLNLSGSALVRIDGSRADLIVNTLLGQQFAGMVNGKVVASVAASALTLAVKTLAGADPSVTDPVIFVFRNSTLSLGDYLVYRVTAALSIVVPSGATLGHVSAINQQLILYAIDNAGTPELAVATKYFDPSVRQQSTTAISAAATDPATIYSNNARANVAWYSLARCISNQAVAGTWAAVPVEIDLSPFAISQNAFAVNRNGVNQTALTAGIFNKVQFTTRMIDTENLYDNVTNFRFQPNVPGLYFFYFQFQAACNGETPQASIFKNGAQAANGFYLGAGAGAGAANMSVSLETLMNGTTDYVEFMAYLPATVTVVAGGTVITFASGNRVGV